MLRTLKRLKYGLLTLDPIDIVAISFISFLYVTAIMYVWLCNQSWDCVIPAPIKTLFI